MRRLQPGEEFRARTEQEEAAFVLLGGTCTISWERNTKRIGKRKNVFDGFPYTLYLPPGNEVAFTAETVCEIAECRVPIGSEARPKTDHSGGCGE